MEDDRTVDELVRLCATVIEPKLGFVASEPGPLESGDGGRLKARIELARQWASEWLPSFEAARQSCPWARPEIVNLRTALANAILRGSDGDAARVFPARTALECAKRKSEWAPADHATNASGDAGNGPPAAVHSPDYRSANWFGTNYAFTANQAACVKVLWEAWQGGASDVGGETLLQAADASTQRIDVVFRGNAAWGTMIVQGGTKGSYQLAKPTADSPKRAAKKTAARARK